MVRRGCAQRPVPVPPGTTAPPAAGLPSGGSRLPRSHPVLARALAVSAPRRHPPWAGDPDIFQRARGGRAEQRTGARHHDAPGKASQTSERPLHGRLGALRKGREAGRVRGAAGPRRGLGGTWAAAVRTVRPPRRDSVSRGLPGGPGESPPARPSARGSRSRVRRNVRTRRPRVRVTVTEQGRRHGDRAGRGPSVCVAAPGWRGEGAGRPLDGLGGLIKPRRMGL